jgi:hypothetical protein
MSRRRQFDSGTEYIFIKDIVIITLINKIKFFQNLIKHIHQIYYYLNHMYILIHY